MKQLNNFLNFKNLQTMISLDFCNQLCLLKEAHFQLRKMMPVHPFSIIEATVHILTIDVVGIYLERETTPIFFLNWLIAAANHRPFF